jgi:hypothetical protein
MPAGARTAPIATMRTSAAVGRPQPAPSLALALGGAGAILLLLVGGQIVFPAKGYEVKQVALDENIEMNGTTGDEPSESQPTTGDERVVMRPTTELEPGSDVDAVEEDTTDSDASRPTAMPRQLPATPQQERSKPTATRTAKNRRLFRDREASGSSNSSAASSRSTCTTTRSSARPTRAT